MQFTPPPYRNPDEEIGQLWGQAIGSGLSSIGQSFAAKAQAQRDQRMQDYLMQLKQQENARAMAEEARKQQQTNAEYGTPAPSDQIFPISGQNTQSQKVREMLSPTTPGPSTGLVARFREWQNQRRDQQMGTPDVRGGAPASEPFPQPELSYQEILPSVPGFTPEQVRAVGGSGMATLGTKRIEVANKLFKSTDFYTPDQVRSLVPGEGADKLINSFPGGKIPKDAVHVAASTGRSEYNMGERTDQFHIKQWNDLTRRTNPSVAPRGSPLGLAGTNNQRADRAIALLSNPQATDQQLMAGVVDLAAIMHGGAPDEMEIANQMYPTLQSKWNRFITNLTSKPVAAKQPEVQQKLRELIADVKTVDNKTIEDNLNAAEEEYADTIARSPERWKRYRGRIMAMTQFVPGSITAPTDFPTQGGNTGLPSIGSNFQGGRVVRVTPIP